MLAGQRCSARLVAEGCHEHEPASFQLSQPEEHQAVRSEALSLAIVAKTEAWAAAEVQNQISAVALLLVEALDLLQCVG